MPDLNRKGKSGATEMTHTPPAQALRLKQLDAHTLAVIWHSISAREFDLLRQPDLAHQSSLDAAANARCVRALAGPMHPVAGDDPWRPKRQDPSYGQ